MVGALLEGVAPAGNMPWQYIGKSVLWFGKRASKKAKLFRGRKDETTHHQYKECHTRPEQIQAQAFGKRILRLNFCGDIRHEPDGGCGQDQASHGGP